MRLTHQEALAPTPSRRSHRMKTASSLREINPWPRDIANWKLFQQLRRYSDKAKALLLSQNEATSFFRASEPSALAALTDPKFNIFYDAGTLIVICCKVRGHQVLGREPAIGSLPLPRKGSARVASGLLSVS